MLRGQRWWRRAVADSRHTPERRHKRTYSMLADSRHTPTRRHKRTYSMLAYSRHTPTHQHLLERCDALEPSCVFGARALSKRKVSTRCVQPRCIIELGLRLLHQHTTCGLAHENAPAPVCLPHPSRPPARRGWRHLELDPVCVLRAHMYASTSALQHTRIRFERARACMHACMHARTRTFWWLRARAPSTHAVIGASTRRRACTCPCMQQIKRGTSAIVMAEAHVYCESLTAVIHKR